MNKIRRALALVPPLILWLIFSVFLWGFVFLQLTDAPREHKIVLCVDARVEDGTSLAVRLEEGKGPGIRMVQARPFTYAMFNQQELTDADLFIVPLSHVETYRDWFIPLPEDMRELEGCLEIDGEPWGAPVNGAAGEYILYGAPGEEEEPYYLFFGKASLHVSGRDGAVDNEAVAAAQRLLSMQ